MGPNSEAVEATLHAIAAADDLRDAGAVALARQYAAALDNDFDGSVLPVIGPKLLVCLIELGATPRSRRAPTKEVESDGDPARAAMDELRAKRAARLG